MMPSSVDACSCDAWHALSVVFSLYRASPLRTRYFAIRHMIIALSKNRPSTLHSAAKTQSAEQASRLATQIATADSETGQYD